MISSLTLGKVDKIADLPDWGIVYVIVIGGATVRVGCNDTALGQNINAGIPLVAPAAINPSNIGLWWIGPMFAIPDANCDVDVEVPTLIHGKTLGGATIRRSLTT